MLVHELYATSPKPVSYFPDRRLNTPLSLQCVGQNYAYNEMSYFLVRLLQQYDRFTLAPEFQPKDSLPPPEWKQRKGRQSVEKIWPSAALTLYVKVRAARALESFDAIVLMMFLPSQGGLWVRFHRAQPS